MLAEQGETSGFAVRSRENLRILSIHFLHFVSNLPDAICSPLNFADEENKMGGRDVNPRALAFWRAHNEALQRVESTGVLRGPGIPL